MIATTLPEFAEKLFLSVEVWFTLETYRKAPFYNASHPAYGAGVANGLGLDASRLAGIEEKLVPAD